MYRKDFYVVQGSVYHFGSITDVGQYNDNFMPLLVKGDPDLLSNLRHERSILLEAYSDNLEVATPPFLTVDGGVKLSFKWKPVMVENGSVVLFDTEDKPLVATNQELQDAVFKVSFSQFSWEYKGKCGTKLVPRKIKLVSFANLNDLFKPDEATSNVTSDF